MFNVDELIEVFDNYEVTATVVEIGGLAVFPSRNFLDARYSRNTQWPVYRRSYRVRLDDGSIKLAIAEWCGDGNELHAFTYIK